MAEKKKIAVQTRLDEEDHEKLLKKCKGEDRKKAGYLRQLIKKDIKDMK